MLLAYTYNYNIRQDKPFLAIMPDLAIDRLALPVPIDKLAISDVAIFYVSNQEAVTVRKEDNGLVIQPLSGQNLYITTNLADRPGVSARELKIIRDPKTSAYICNYKKEKDTTWREWTPYAVQL